MKEKNSIPKWLYYILPIVIIGLWVISFLSIYFGFNNWSERGAFGDLFGSINALFSGLAFAGLIVAILLQRQELQLQREELQETRQELARTADAQENNLQLSTKYHEENLRQSIQSHTHNTRFDTLNSLLMAYSTILNPQSGMKNRNIDNNDLNEEIIKKKFLKTLNEIEEIMEENKK